jgi:hypothetical protein
MDINHLCENTTQKDELAKAFIKTIEKISGVQVLDTQLYTDFTLRIKPTVDFTIPDYKISIELTEEQFNRLTDELQLLITA